MALIPLLFISISDSLVILVFLRAFDFEKGGVVVFSSSISQNSSSPHISVLSTVAKHTHTDTCITWVYQKKKCLLCWMMMTRRTGQRRHQVNAS